MEMKLWGRRVAGAVKDGNSLITADDALKIAVVKATSHDELSMDSDNADFIYRYVRTDPSSFRQLLRAISSRVGRTHSWPVALKGLMLVHGMFLGKFPAAESMGRLPFDLSVFGRSGGGFTLFVREYFTFLDQRSIIFHDANPLHEQPSSVMTQLAIIRKMQSLVDSLLQIKPTAENMRTPLIIEAMDHVTAEILEIYGRICRGLAQALPNVHSMTGKPEAELALKIVAKSNSHREELSWFFEFCKDFGVPKARDIPDFVRISESDIVELEKLVHGGPTAVQSDKEERSADERVRVVEEEVTDLITLDQMGPEIPDLIKL